MCKINSDYLSLQREYIFPIIENKLIELKSKHSPLPILNFGIGDISLPLSSKVAKALSNAAFEMTQSPIGYGPSHGYSFLREAIAQQEYDGLIEPSEIFISDGINSDCAHLQEIFSRDIRVGVPDPSYPVYWDTNVLGGRKQNIVFLPCTKKSDFLPVPPDFPLDLIYLCSPHNPTGAAMTQSALQEWVNYAKQHKAIIIFDSAYKKFVSTKNVAQSIYEIPGARDVAIELGSFSKSAGFTGVRCGWTVVPKTLFGTHEKETISLHRLWGTKQSIESNGVSYPVQRAAQAVYSPEGKEETEVQVQEYKKVALLLKNSLLDLGFDVSGGLDAPYIWWKTPEGFSSWEFFDHLLTEYQILTIPGVGFGRQGEGYVRISAFTTSDVAHSALERVSAKVLQL